MKTRYIYAMSGLALTMALTACNDAKKADAAAPAVAQFSVDSRAQALGLVALFPADVSSVAAVYDLPSMVKGIANLNIVKKGNGLEPEDADKCKVVDAAIAFGPGMTEWVKQIKEPSAKMYADSLKLMFNSYKMVRDADRGNLSEREIRRALSAPGIGQMLNLMSMVDLSQSQKDTAPVTVAVNLTPDMLDKVRAALKDMGLPKELALHGIVTMYDKTYNGIDCKVCEVDCTKLKQKLEVEMGSLPNEEFAAKVKDVLKKLDGAKLYAAVGFKDNTMLAFLTTNPEKQVRVAASAKESVLSRADFNMADAKTGKAYGLLYAEAELMKAAAELSAAECDAVMVQAKEILKELGADWNVVNVDGCQECLESIRKTCAGIYANQVNNAKTLTAYCWQDQGVKLELSGTSGGLCKLDETTTMNSVRPTDSTVLYFSACADMDTVKSIRSMIGNASQIVWDYACAYISKPEHGVDNSVRMAMPVAQMALPMVQDLWAADGKLTDSLTGSHAFTLDYKGAPVEMMNNAPGPRVAFAFGLKDRKALGEAWDALKAVFGGSALPMLTMGQMSKLPEPQPEMVGDTTIYSYNELGLPEALNPVVAVNDKAVALAMPKSYGVDVLKQAQAAPAADVAPLEFRLNLLPLRNFVKTAKAPRDVREALDVISTDIEGVRITGKRNADGQDVYLIHIISAR